VLGEYQAVLRRVDAIRVAAQLYFTEADGARSLKSRIPLKSDTSIDLNHTLTNCHSFFSIFNVFVKASG
jgi:hypothetical protein